MQNELSKKELAVKCVDTINKKANFENHLGIKVLDVDEGYCTLSMKVQEFMLNGHGTCQGGAVFSFADTAFAYACNTRNVPTVAYSCDITFIRASFLGDELFAKGDEIDLLKRNGIYNIEVKNQKDELVALFIGKSRAINGTII